MDDKSIINQEGSFNPLEDMALDINDLSMADQAIDYSELIEQDVFIGGTPYDTISEGITDQFNNYMTTEDSTNYVDIFYDQLYASYEVINSDDEEDHPQEKIEVLDNLYEKFVNTIYDLIKTRLAIVIPVLEDGGAPDNKDEIEYILRRVYEFFILDARKNFKVAISTDLIHKVNYFMTDPDVEYFKKINILLDTNYTPLVRMSPRTFLEYRGDKEIIELFDDSEKIHGNFLRRYTPKLYENEEFRVDLINYITMLENFKEDLTNGGEQQDINKHSN